MDLVKIGSYIAEKRKKLGMTQKQLAEKLGKSDKSVSKWERGICLPDVSVYLELCEILGISLNEFLAGEDIEVTNVEKKSEDTLIQISKDSSHKQRYLKKIIAILLIAVGVFAITLGIMVCNKLRQPQNYIEAVDPDSVEMKTAELLSGIDGTMMFRYNSKDTFQALYVYLSEYHSGKRVSHKRVLELSYEDVKSAKNGLIVITPDFDNFTAKLIAADEYSKYMTETPILEGVANREYYGRSATSIENKSTIEYGTEQGLAALIYGEQMENVSTSVNVYTTLGEIQEKLGGYRLFKRQPAPTDIRRTIALLRKYQIIEPLELLDDLNSSSPFMIYPCINVVLLGDDVRALLQDFDNGDTERIEPDLAEEGGNEDGTEE